MVAITVLVVLAGIVQLAEQQVPQTATASILSVTEDRYAVLAILNAFFVVVGSSPADSLQHLLHPEGRGA